MAKEFLGRGWKFPIKIDNEGGVAISQYEEKVKESITIILSTAKGERVMRPEFGCDIHEFPFSIINTSTLTMIKSAVKEALVLWEPRIEIIDIEVSTERIDEGILLIKIDYKIIAINTEFNMVFPFYLKTGGL